LLGPRLDSQGGEFLAESTFLAEGLALGLHLRMFM
jgi:hypothetical protein